MKYQIASISLLAGILSGQSSIEVPVGASITVPTDAYICSGTITSSTTFNGTATIIPVNTSSGAVTITIDSDQKVAGRILIFKSLSSSNQFTLATEGSEQIQGRSSNLEDTFDTNTGYQTVHLFCDGSNWYDLNY